MQFVDQASAEVLANGFNASAQANVLTVCGGHRSFQRAFYSAGDEMECRAASHCNRVASVVSQHERIAMIGWVVAPPALPIVIWPRTANGSEHVAAQDPGADVLKPANGKVVVDTGLAVFLAMHPPEGLGWKDPLHNRRAAFSEGVFEALIRTCAVAVERDAKTLHA